MNLSELFIRRPVMTTLTMLAILFFGGMAYTRLPESDLPNVDFPTILVQAALPGASPETMAAAIATPLERQFSTIAGLDSMNSTSSQGTSAITLQFNLNRNIDAAALDVQAAISQASQQLPKDMPALPSFQKVNPADQPILYVGLTSSTLPLYKLDEYGETIMAQRISTVSGVAQVLVFGSQKYAVRVQLDPGKLASYSIGIDDVAQAIGRGNVNLPTGTLQGTHRAFTVQAQGQLMAADAYLPLIVTYRNGSPVRIRDLGRAIDSVENDKTAAWYCTSEAQQRSIILTIQRQPGTNTVAVANAVRDLLPTFRAQIPASVSLHVLFDRSEKIRESAHDVKFTLLLTLSLVILVIFLFLRNISATIIPSLTLPLSIIGTFGVMNLLGYSLDNLSLMALTLSVGFVVDDAIVMLENIFRHGEMGKPALQAALDASREISFTIISMTLSLAAVFIPFLFMSGLLGRLFREFAVTIGVAVLISGVIALTLIPMLGSRFLRHRRTAEGAQAEPAATRRGWILRGYERGLRFVIRHRFVTLLFALATFVVSIHFFNTIPKGFIPNEDRDLIFGYTQAIEGISWESMSRHQQALNSVLQTDPNIESFMSSAGARGTIATPNAGVFFGRLLPAKQRKLSADELVQILRVKVAGIPGIQAYVQNPPAIQVGGQLTKSQYQLTLQSPDLSQLYRYATLMEEKMRALPGFQDVTTDLQLRNPQINLTIDRDKASALGVTAEQIETALLDAYGSRQVSTIFTPTNEYRVLVELLPEFQRDPTVLSTLYVQSDSGRAVPLSAVARIERGVGPLTVTHFGQLPSATVSFNLKPGTALGPAVDEVNAIAAKTLPASIVTNFQGTAQVFQSSLQGLGLLLLMATVVIYLVLGILYESFIHPLTILSALPLAGLGALLTLKLFHVELSVYAFVGLIMLIGLVKKNGIMMIDFALESQKKGAAPADAIIEACVIRFRPIMMTTLAALMAGLPIAFGWGGAEARRPLGLAVVGGLVFSQSLTLFVTPVIYLYLERLRHVFRRKPDAAHSG